MRRDASCLTRSAGPCRAMPWPFEPFEPSAQANQGYWPAQGAGQRALTRPACAMLRDRQSRPIRCG